MASKYLFVYGTLKSDAAGAMGWHQRQRLKAEARFVGPGRINGRLYDLGRYPGLVLSAEPGETVYGEVVELLRPFETLEWLDIYEDVSPHGNEADEYSRVTGMVELGEEKTLPAWVYVCRSVGCLAKRIAGGRWTAAR